MKNRPTPTRRKRPGPKLCRQGKVAPEDFDKSFTETPKAFYVTAEGALDDCTATLQALDTLCQEKFGDIAPSFRELKKELETVRHSVHLLLQKKRETEPDAVEAEAEPGAGAPKRGQGEAAAARKAGRAAAGASELQSLWQTGSLPDAGMQSPMWFVPRRPCGSWTLTARRLT